MAWRVRLPLRRSLFLAGAVAAALILLLPLRLAVAWLGHTGLAAREASGSMWFGRLAEARFGEVPLGDLSARLRPLPLLLGRARIALAGADARGAVTLFRHGMALDGVTAHVPLGPRLLPLPITAIVLDDVSAEFRDGLCVRAEGLVKAVVTGAPDGFAMPGGLSGAARCDGGELLLPLVSQSGMEGLTLRVAATGGYRAELRIRPTTPAARDALAGAGFVATGGGYALAVTGSL